MARRRALIADDDPLIRIDLAEMLTEEGLEVVGQVGDGERAVEQARKLRPDLVLLDVKMPGIDGIQATAARYAEAAALRAELAAATQRLQARKVIDRAKGLLMTQQGMTEPQALHWLKRTAMDRRTSMDAVARDLLEHRLASAS